MNWLDVFCFSSVARTSSFSITARELMISQQAVSRHIRNLEEELGYALFLRNSQTVRLTLAGERMLNYFTKRDELVRRYRAGLPQGNGRPVLRIAWLEWLGSPLWLRNCIADFGEQNPSLELLCSDLCITDLLRALENNDIDLLIASRYTARRLPTVWHETELSEEPIFLVSNAWQDESRDRVSLYPQMAAYAGESDEAGVRQRVGALCAKLDIHPQHTEVFPDMGSVCLNVLVKEALMLGTKIDAIEQNGDFILRPTGLTTTAVLCRPYLDPSSPAADFERFVCERRGIVQ